MRLLQCSDFVLVKNFSWTSDNPEHMHVGEVYCRLAAAHAAADIAQSCTSPLP
jgi:hypothetical protein